MLKFVVRKATSGLRKMFTKYELHESDMVEETFTCTKKCIFIPLHKKLPTGSISSRSVRVCVYALEVILLVRISIQKFIVFSMDTAVAHLPYSYYEPSLP